MPDTLNLFGATIELNANLVLLLVIVYIAGIIRGFTGFGSALLIVPALAVIYGPVQAVVIEVMIEVPVTLGLLPVAIKKAVRKTVLPMLLMFLLFVPVGTLFLKVFDPGIMKIVISLLVLFFVVVIAFQNQLAILLTRGGVLAAGVFSGISQGMTGMAGPLFATALLARGEGAAQTRANITAVSGGLIFFTAASFFLFDLVTVQAMIYAAIATPAILLGAWTGVTLFARLSHWNLRGVILVFLALTAIVTLFQAVV
jgi:uncharacterized protein